MLRNLTICLIAGLTLGCVRGFHDSRQAELTRPAGDYLQHFATSVEYPDAEDTFRSDLSEAPPPRTLEDPSQQTLRPITLDEAMRLTLASSEVIRSLGGTVLQTPSSRSVYDVGLEESNPGGGVEAALAAFDAQATATFFFNKTERPVNQAFPGLFRPVFLQNSSNFLGQVSKTSALGSQYTLRHHVQYTNNNNESQSFQSAYNIDYEAEWRQPLLQGAGLAYNRIAGPSGAPGAASGVLLARLNTDVAISDFEASVIGMAADVEQAFWDLYFSYHDLDARIIARQSALTTWRSIAERARLGLRGGEPENEAQARAQYFLFESQVQEALSGQNGLYAREEQLRLLLGLPPNDGNLLQPEVQPVLARVVFDWSDIVDEALLRRVELRRQKWQVKRRELELTAAQNHLLPRLDAVALYRWFGFGDDLIRSSRGPTGFETAYQNLTGGDFQEWSLGLEFSAPIGYRRAAAGVRFAELQLARENAILKEQQFRVTHELSSALRQVHQAHQAIKANFNRRVASQNEVKVIEGLFDAGRAEIHLLLQSQERLAAATSAYYRTVADYNLALAQLHQQKGSLLEFDRIRLAEGPWSAAAHDDAHRRSLELGRRHGHIHAPSPLSVGEYEQMRHPEGAVQPAKPLDIPPISPPSETSP